MPVCRDSASRAPYLAISPCTPLQRLLLGSRVIPPKPRGRRCRDLGPDFFVLCVLLLVCFGCVCPKDRNRRGEVANGPGETLQRVGSFRCKPQTAFKKLQRWGCRVLTVLTHWQLLVFRVSQVSFSFGSSFAKMSVTLASSETIFTMSW